MLITLDSCLKQDFLIQYRMLKPWGMVLGLPADKRYSTVNSAPCEGIQGEHVAGFGCTLNLSVL